MILIRYGEVGLKGKNVRRKFENILIRNIKRAFLNEKIEALIETDWGRIYLYTDENKKCIEILKRIFGIVSFSEVIESSSHLSDICNNAVELSKKIIGNKQKFAVRSRRCGVHQYTSQDISKAVGSAILNADEGLGLKVDLKNPDVEIFVEVRNKKAYIFSKIIPGIGGLPLGSQGTVISILDDRNSIIASWLLMKRGCNVISVFFGDDEKKIEKWVELLKKWDPKLKFFFEKCTSLDEQIELLDEMVRKSNASGIVVGRGLDKDIEKLRKRIPIFYPLIGLEKNEIDEIWKKIGGDNEEDC
ncbi:MAG: THUMP domain-containing protein [Candidatus Thermoplasmatota archaeon]